MRKQKQSPDLSKTRTPEAGDSGGDDQLTEQELRDLRNQILRELHESRRTAGANIPNPDADASLQKRIEQVRKEFERLRRAESGDQEAFDHLVQTWVDELSPLVQAELPGMPQQGNLQQISNENLDQLTLDAERRITRFVEFYPHLDATQSWLVRETLDAMRHSLQREREHRGLPPLSPRIEASSSAVGADAAKKEPARNAPRPIAELTEREKKIYEVIRRGSKGLQYCRELDAAGIKPRRTGVWKGCPATYTAAYLEGAPWRHRIENEKSKIKQKAELAKTRKSLAGE